MKVENIVRGVVIGLALLTVAGWLMDNVRFVL